MELTIRVKNTENIGAITPELTDRLSEIFSALVTSGGLTGVKGGQTIIHFDGDGTFQKIELKYFPWQRRRSN